MTAATTEARAAVIREIFWQPLRIADHDKANEALDALVAELEEAVVALREVKQAAFELEIKLTADKVRLREALEAIDTNGKRLRIDQGRGLQAHITEALNEC